MADAPQGIHLGRYRDLDGRGWHIWIRRVLLGLLGLFLVAGLLNVFGQRPSSASASSPEASLKVYGPAAVRGGLLWEARFTVHADREIKDAVLVLSSGWLEDNSVNTIEPSPIGEGSRNGSMTLDLGHIPKGETHDLYMQFQTNPTNIGHRNIDTQLQDGERLLLSVHRELTIWP